MNSHGTGYGFFVENCLLKPLKVFKTDTRTAYVGQGCMIIGTSENGEILVRMQKDDDSWDPHTFSCPKHLVAPIKEKLFPFILAIPSPQERLKLAKNGEKCEKLANLSKDMTVAVSLNDDTALGVIKYTGNVKGIGKCIGIQLNQKREKHNKHDGTSGGIRYFDCPPGHGIFATIDRINPTYVAASGVDVHKKSDLDLSLEKQISEMFLRDKELEPARPKYEEIITKYGEYQNISNSKNTTYMRNSLSLQNILDIDKTTTNSNNDFDNNSIIPPDKTYLMHENDARKKVRNKSEMDLIEHTSDYRRINCGKNEEILKHSRNKSVGVMTQMLENGSAARKKIANDLRVVGGSKSTQYYNEYWGKDWQEGINKTGNLWTLLKKQLVQKIFRRFTV